MSTLPRDRLTDGSMKLLDALKIIAQPPQQAATETLTVALVCSFTPLHLQTFLTAELRLRFPAHQIVITTGLFDDLPGTLRDLRDKPLDAVAVVLEWFDLDARLGLRRLGGWSPHAASDVVEHARARLAQLRLALDELSRTSAIVVSLPTLPLPPLFTPAGWQAGVHELELRESLLAFAATVARNPKVRIVSEAAASGMSPVSERLNVQSTWASGFPYQTAHAARMAQLVGRAIQNAPPKKGLITDLDDTLWRGIVGDDGVQSVSWDLDHHTQEHGLYQQFLSALSEAGVLVGVASKNDPRVVEDAFAREDLLVSRDRIFPFAVSWGSKAQAVSSVLEAWNVSADTVVFVDDNPAELEEVRAAHPGIECIRFPTGDSEGIYRLLIHLRDVFGRATVTEEDRIRLDSLRSGASVRETIADAGGYSESLLADADATLTLHFGKDPSDARALELLNKTNQFNLNGRRMTERALAEFLADPQTFLLTASYKDKFGPLGKVAVLAGRVADAEIRLHSWVMSCRAFARRIEHRCLEALFDRFGARAAAFDYAATPRNEPLTRFLQEISGSPPAPGILVTADAFRAACPTLFHRVIVTTDSRI